MKKGIYINIVSPYGLAVVSYVIFLAGWVFSPKLYSQLTSEPDLMFLDLITFAFYSLCVFAFIIAVFYVDLAFPKKEIRLLRFQAHALGTRSLLVPLVIGIAFCIASCLLIVRQYPSLVYLFMAQIGSAIKESDIGLHVPLGLSNTFLMGMLWWATWRFTEGGVRRTSNGIFVSVWAVGMLCCCILALLKISRGELMPLIFGTGIIYLIGKAKRIELTRRFLLMFLGIMFCFLLSIFLLISHVRGSQWELFGSELVGYTIASYNRLSALLHYKLRYPFGGHGIYLCSLFHANNMLNAMIPIRNILGWPDFVTLWTSEFDAVSSAGLNGSMIWSGAFGYIFSEVGWFTPFILFVYGLVYGVVWRMAKSGNTFGIILYPWFAFCIIFWFGTNYLLDNKILALFLIALILFMYEHLQKRKYRAASMVG